MLKIQIPDPRVAEALALGLTDLGAPPAFPEPTPVLPDGRDAVAIASMLLAIPQTIVACWDLKERLAKLGPLRRWLALLPADTHVVVSASDGRSAVIGRDDVDKLLDLTSHAVFEPAWDVFLAHASGDEAAARELHAALEARGLRCFLRDRCIRPGTPWEFAVMNAQTCARSTAVLVAPARERDWYQAEEILRAVELARRGPHTVVPIYRDGPPADAHDIPFGLLRIAGLDLRSGPTAVASAIYSILETPR